MEGRPDGRIERPDPSRLRISDEDRHRVAEVLRLAAGEGRIDFQELDERLEAAYAAKTYGDLVPITADLPTHPAVQPSPPPVVRPSAPLTPASSYTSSVAIMSETRRQGAWLVPEHHTAFSMMGSVRLDLREAQFAARDVTIYANSIMGDVTIVVNAHTRVVVEGVAIMADFSEARAKVPAELTPDSPVVRVKGFALMAGVSVQRRAMPGESRRSLRR
jgi:hypothetical protein